MAEVVTEIPEAAVPAAEVPVAVAPAATAPAATAPAAAADELVALEEEEVPLAVLDLEDEEEEDAEEAVEIEEEEVPQASIALAGGSIGHCILHIIELIVTGIIAIFDIGGTSNEKRKIKKLKEEMESGEEGRGE